MHFGSTLRTTRAETNLCVFFELSGFGTVSWQTPFGVELGCDREEKVAFLATKIAILFLGRFYGDRRLLPGSLLGRKQELTPALIKMAALIQRCVW